MDSFEINKLLGGLLGAIFVVFTVALVSDAIFASPAPETPGYVIEAVEAEVAGGAEAPEVVPLGVRLAAADAAAGETVFKKCAACHTVEQGGANKVGPNLWGTVMRPIASHEGFAYSGALKEFSEGGAVVWDYEHLDQFLLSPKGLVRGTAMAFAGLKDDEDRTNVIAYLRSLSDNPAPLPVVEEAEAAAVEGEAAPDAAVEPAAEGVVAPPVEPAAEPEAAEQPVPVAPATDAPAVIAPAPEAPAAEEPVVITPVPDAPADAEVPAAEQPAIIMEPAPETPDQPAILPVEPAGEEEQPAAQ